MNESHITESEIQAYVLQTTKLSDESLVHIRNCRSCQFEIENYRVVFSGLKQLPIPTFDFDLKQLVMSKIPVTQKLPRKIGILSYAIALLGIVGIGFSIYYAREYWTDLFWGIPQISIFIIIVAAIGLLLFQALDYYRKFRHKMNRLYFS